MSKIAVQEERGPRKQKAGNISMIDSQKHNTPSPLTIKATTPSSIISPLSYTSNNPFNYNMLGQILIACVKQARDNERFSQLSKQQQTIILKTVWSECFVLRASHWPIDILPIIEQ